MGSLKPITMAGFLTVAAATAAPAADMLPPPPVVPVHAPVVEVGGGWYLRGDVGVGHTEMGEFSGKDTNPRFRGPPGGYKVEKQSIDDQIFVAAGIGYQFNSWVRADITGEYRAAASFKTAESYRYPPNPRGFNVVDGKLKTVVGLANVYVDLGTFWGITPFVGAGVGLAHHDMYGLIDTGFGAAAGGIGTVGDKTKTNFAWALHAGLGYDVSQTLKLEFAYRYLNMGDAESGKLRCFGGGRCPDTVYKLKEVEAHDFKIGMRWMLQAPTPVAVAPVHGPLIRKY
jgi:opacity protein-like surface antigen